MRHGVAVLFVAFTLVALAGCSGMEDPTVSRAKAVYQQTIEMDRPYAAYAASLASGNESDFVRKLLLERAASDHYPTALEAVRALQDDPPAEAAPVLEQVFTGKSGALKMQAAVALARLGNEDALSWLKEQVDEGNALLNRSVIELLVDRGETESLEPQLKTLMKSDSLVSRNEAYAILGSIRQTWATSLLAGGLENEYGEERQTAIAALGSSGDPRVAELISRFAATQGLVFVTLEALGDVGNEESIPLLEKKLDHKEKLVRVYAAIALWKLGREEEAVAALEPLLNDEDPVVRRLIAEQLGDLSGGKAVELLGVLAGDEDRDTRLHALRSLAFIATPAEESILVESASDSDYEVSTAAINGLAKVGGAGTIEQLAPMLENRNPYVALSAANAILAISAREKKQGE